jgi:heme-degrading monooxygenase HmoA
MYTRLLTFTNATDIDAGVDYLAEEVMPVLDGQRGFRGVSASGDRSAAVLTILSLWDTEADRSASDSALGKARDEAVKRVGGSLEIENFEQTVQSVVRPPVKGCQLNIARVRMEPASIDANIEWFKDQVLPQISSQPGFCALRNMVDRQTGRAITGSVFVDRESADASLANMPARRSAAEARGVTFEDISQREILISVIK